MPRTSKKRVLEDNYFYTFRDDFFSAITSLKDKDEVAGFFRELLTKEELVMLTKRFQAVMMTVAGYNQQEIDRMVKVTQSTISHLQERLESSDGHLVNAAEIILKYKTSEFEKQGKTKIYKSAETDLLKEAIAFGVNKIANVVVQKRKENSIRK